MTANTVRVLHVAGSLGTGGTEKVMQLFAAHLDRTRFQTAVLAAEDGPRGALLREAGIPTFVGADAGRVLDRFAPQVVHVHRAGWAEPEALRPLRLYRRNALRAGRRVVLVETNVFGRHDPSPGAADIDATLFVSHFCARRYAAVHGIATVPPRYHVIYNPVDTDFFAAHTPAPEERDYALPVIGRISRPDPGKWSSLALDFLPPVVRALPQCRYRIIGGIEKARRFVAENNLAPHVEFLPPVLTDAGLAAFFSSVSLLAHANDAGESFGLVIAEAMACGLPVVTHPARGMRDNAQLELVEHGVTGLVADSAGEYAQAVLWLLRNPDEARRMGSAGRDKARRLFRARTVTAQLEAVYGSLLFPQDGGGGHAGQGEKGEKGGHAPENAQAGQAGDSGQAGGGGQAGQVPENVQGQAEFLRGSGA